MKQHTDCLALEIIQSSLPLLSMRSKIRIQQTATSTKLYIFYYRAKLTKIYIRLSYTVNIANTAKVKVKQKSDVTRLTMLSNVSPRRRRIE